jgi:murein DD-endopeptidase MepM/ murein hydrolase activator NlpD
VPLRLRLVLLTFVVSLTPAPAVGAATTPGWAWPVVGPVIRGFQPPSTPYGSGHRGIDIAAPIGTPVVAPAPSVVKFAGAIAGNLFVTLDHGGGVASTYSWVSSILVRKGDAVQRGAVIALSGTGHPGETPPHLHFGVKLNDSYIDPLSMLAPLSVVGLIRLAPI